MQQQQQQQIAASREGHKQQRAGCTAAEEDFSVLQLWGWTGLLACEVCCPAAAQHAVDEKTHQQQHEGYLCNRVLKQ